MLPLTSPGWAEHHISNIFPKNTWDHTFHIFPKRWGPYLWSCLWGFNMGKLKLSQIPYPMVHCGYRSTLEGPGSISLRQYLNPTLGKFPPLYGPHLSKDNMFQSIQLHSILQNQSNQSANHFLCFWIPGVFTRHCKACSCI